MFTLERKGITAFTVDDARDLQPEQSPAANMTTIPAPAQTSTYLTHLQQVVNDMTQASFDDVIAEVRKVSQRLESIERALTSMMTMLMPEEDLSPEEWKELESIEAEMISGKTVPLEELEKALR